jgi:hypothetical protein
MAVSETAAQEHDVAHGKLIALEGDEEVLATQLRLLPPSEKFLVIPSISENFSDKHDIDPRTYVREVHLTFEDRTETARAFLRAGTSAHPRLVFMNGGSVRARRMCISKICQHTNGDVGAAENIFNQIVQYGVGGLMKDTSGPQPEKAAINGEAEQGKEAGSPRAKIMIAAEPPKRRATKLDDTGGSGSSPAHAMKTIQSEEDVPMPTQDIFNTKHGDQIRLTLSEIPQCDALQKHRTSGLQYENTEYDPYADIASSGDGSYMSGGPPTPAVVYGEACLVSLNLPETILHFVSLANSFWDILLPKSPGKIFLTSISWV